MFRAAPAKLNALRRRERALRRALKRAATPKLRIRAQGVLRSPWFHRPDLSWKTHNTRCAYSDTGRAPLSKLTRFPVDALWAITRVFLSITIAVTRRSALRPAIDAE